MPSVLIVTYGGGHAALMSPVIQELRSRRRTEPIVLGLTTGGALYRSRGMQCSGYVDYIRPGLDDDATALGERLVGDVNSASVGVSREESVAYMGLCMRDLIAEVGPERAWTLYGERGRHAFLPRRTLRRIIDAERPSVVVATNSPKSERAAILEGNQRGIPTLMVPDLFVDPTWEIYHPFEAQWYAAMCQTTANNLVRHHGVAKERIIITGQPVFDKAAVPEHDECRQAVTAALGLPRTTQYIVVATGWDMQSGPVPAPTNNHSRRVVELLRTAHEEWSNITFVVKPHPSEAATLYNELARQSAHLVVAPPRSDINQLLRGSVGMIAASTTTAVVDALSLDVPVMSVDWSTTLNYLPYSELCVPQVRREDEFRGAITRFLRDPKFLDGQEEVRRQFRHANRGATGRVATLIEQLASGALTN